MKNISHLKTICALCGFKLLFILAIAMSLPGLLASAFLIYFSSLDSLESFTLTLAILVPWVILLSLFYLRGIRPWQAVANILMSFREQDFSLRIRTNDSNDVVNKVLVELNHISAYMRDKKIDAYESQKLLSRVLAELDLAVFLFNQNNQLVLLNPYAAALYTEDKTQTLNKTLKELKLDFTQLAVHTSIQSIEFPNKKSRWLVKQSSYRQQGLPFKLIVMADIGADLRKEELDAWQKLIRTLSHEINNALTPLKTTVGTMRRTLANQNKYPDWQDDFRESLDIINNRIDNLNRLVTSYSQLARLPIPNKKPMQLSTLWTALKNAQTQVQFIEPLDDIELTVDQAQIEQALINLINNAKDATSTNETHKPQIQVKIETTANKLTFYVLDNGCGIQNTDNLFVPYFTTKANGSGIGLVLSRQISELHGGSLQLSNRQDQTGCEARLSITAQ